MFDERSPIYRQIAERITTDILQGELAEGDPVMSTNEYAAFYRINPATAAKAFQLLVEDGVLYKRRGIGMFVSPGARDHLRRQRQASFFTDVVEPMVAEARAIGMPLRDVIDRLESLEKERGQ